MKTFTHQLSKRSRLRLYMENHVPPVKGIFLAEYLGVTRSCIYAAMGKHPKSLSPANWQKLAILFDTTVCHLRGCDCPPQEYVPQAEVRRRFLVMIEEREKRKLHKHL